MPKFQPLQIPINITTGYLETGDKVKDDILRIDQTSYYLNALFWAINISAKGYNLLEMETSHELFRFPDFRENVEMLSEIGIGLTEQLTTYSVNLNNSEKTEDKQDNV